MRMLFCTILILGSLCVKAQSPGYAGKKFAVYGIADLTYNRYADKYGRFYNDPLPVGNPYTNNIITKFPVFPGIGFEYTFSFGCSAGMSYRYLVNHNATSLVRYYNFESDLGYFGEYNLQANIYSVYLKYYFYNYKGAIAPLGIYASAEYYYAKGNLTNGLFHSTDTAYIALFTTEKFTPLESIEELYPNPALAHGLRLTVGREFILFNLIPFDIGVQGSIIQNIGYDNDDPTSLNLSGRLYDLMYLGITTKTGIFLF